MKIIFLVLSISFLITSCGKDQLSTQTANANSNAPSALIQVCKNVSQAGSYGGCCSYHGGAKSCGASNMYMFSDNDRLLCNDGTISPSCIKN